jgi:6-hydroxycyclohex-1-ene-1-carbonyl-CoA dehydrogenase
VNIHCWQMTAANEPMELATRDVDPGALTGDQALVEVAGCGVCHTDLGFVYDGVRTRHALPLTLGHEIAGRVVAAGPDSAHLIGRAVVVPAVIPCGECDPCVAGRGAICATQFFPGNDDHGGFASHVVVPGRGLCVVDEEALAASDIDLASLSVIADAVTTPYQAIVNAGLTAGDVAIFIGVGGVGGFGVQIANHMGAHVVAIDVNPTRLAAMADRGASLSIESSDDLRGIKKQIRTWAKENGHRGTGWKIFETSGHPAGQQLAFSLLGYDAHLAVVGYTRAKIEVRLSNLMAFDATMRGTWGCLPEHYPAVVAMVLSGAVKLDGFIEARSMGTINDTFAALHRHELTVRPVLIPDFA